jgi:flagellar protein FlaG
MDTGLAIRPTANAAQMTLVRPDAAPAPVREAVATDLAPAQSVTASTGADASRHDSGRAAQDAHVRKVILDAHSREVIFQVLDESSGRVVRQVPDEAMLRLRAYTRAAADLSPNEANRANLEA